jgi:hypothetical protein
MPELLAYVYILFYAIVMEADMRLSYADLHVPSSGACPDL